MQVDSIFTDFSRGSGGQRDLVTVGGERLGHRGTDIGTATEEQKNFRSHCKIDELSNMKIYDVLFRIDENELVDEFISEKTAFMGR